MPVCPLLALMGVVMLASCMTPETLPPAPTAPAPQEALPVHPAEPPAPMPVVPAAREGGPARRTVQTHLRERPALVNVRPEPGTTRPAVAVLKAGKAVEVLEERGGWLKVRWKRPSGTVEGWINRKFAEGYD